MNLLRTFDTATGKVTMYRLVTLCLSAIAVVALLLSLLGRLPFAFVDLITSLAVALLVTLLSNMLFALAFRVRPHTESSVVTALLLFFLLWPSAALGDLGVLALTALLASASKYVLAWRGRHILNPAAAGATLIAFTGLNPAVVWWVATGALLPVVLIGALLVLFRTRHLSMGAVFVIVAGVILTARLATQGQDLPDALATVFTAYPLVFFAGFMLSEPLTLPPRRWQQLALAVVVGVLFTVPFSLGPFFLSFELALVIGNALAFLVGQRRGIKLTFTGRRQLTPTAWEFDLSHPAASGCGPGSISSCMYRTPGPIAAAHDASSAWPRRRPDRATTRSRSECGSLIRRARSSRPCSTSLPAPPSAPRALAATSCCRAIRRCRCCSWRAASASPRS